MLMVQIQAQCAHLGRKVRIGDAVRRWDICSTSIRQVTQRPDSTLQADHSSPDGAQRNPVPCPRSATAAASGLVIACGSVLSLLICLVRIDGAAMAGETVDVAIV